MLLRYQNESVSFLTKHGKERVIAPVLEQALGCQVCWVDGFDTDTLGSFSRETPRVTSALETCRHKACGCSGYESSISTSSAVRLETMLSSARTIDSASSRLRSWSATIFSSTVSRAISR